MIIQYEYNWDGFPLQVTASFSRCKESTGSDPSAHAWIDVHSVTHKGVELPEVAAIIFYGDHLIDLIGYRGLCIVSDALREAEQDSALSAYLAKKDAAND